MIDKKLTVTEVAETCDVERNAVLGWITSGKLPAVKVGKQKPKYLVSERDLQKYLLDVEYYGHPEKIYSNAFMRVPDIEYCWPINLIRDVLEIDDEQIVKPKIDVFDIDIRDFLNMVNSLADREKKIVELKFQFGFSLREIASIYGITFERIRQILSKAERKLAYQISCDKCTIVSKRDYDKVVFWNEELKEANAKLKEELSKYVNEIEEKKEDSEDAQQITIDVLDLNVRSYNCLKRAGLNTIRDIINYDSNQEYVPDKKYPSLISRYSTNWLAIRNLGSKSIDDIARKVYAYCGYVMRYCTREGFSNVI